jgi:hypothetical protein
MLAVAHGFPVPEARKMIYYKRLTLRLRNVDSVHTSSAVMQKGQIVHRGSSTDFRRDRDRAYALLGVG